jgi:hypothetical protein
MPTINRQRPVPQVSSLASSAPAGSILSTAVPVTSLRQDCVIASFYGRNRSGKTTLAAQFPKPLLFVSCEPAHCGGVQSVSNMEGVTVIEVHDKPTADGSPHGRRKVEAIGAELAGNTYYRTVVLKTVTSLQDVIGEEMKRENPNMPWAGKGSKDTYQLRSQRLHEAMRSFLDLRHMHVVMLAQEKDHNPPTDEKTGFPDLKAKLLHTMQQGSFMAPALGAANAQWLQDACGYIVQVYEDEVMQDVVVPMHNPDGTPAPSMTQRVGTGRRQRHLRLQYHPNFAAGGKWCYDPNMPEFVTAPDPQGLFAALARYIPAIKQ